MKLSRIRAKGKKMPPKVAKKLMAQESKSQTMSRRSSLKTKNAKLAKSNVVFTRHTLEPLEDSHFGHSC